MTRTPTFPAFIAQAGATTLAIAASALFLAGSAAAQQGTGAMTPAAASGAMTGKAGAPSSGDKKFAMDAAKGGMAEVALGQAAKEKGASDGVKQFGARMVEDHTKANDELKQIATAKGITLPASPPKDPMVQKIEAKSGAEFDRAYMAQMLVDHKKTVALFEKESRSGTDPELKAFATKTLPTLKEHLQMVQSNQHGGAAMKP